MAEKTIIKNFKELATSALRGQALEIAEAAYAAIDTQNAVRKNFVYDAKKQKLKILGREFIIGNFKRIVCVGFGKAALEAVTAIQSILSDKITCGYVLDLKEGSLGNIVCKVGTHPLPTKVNIEATKELMAMLAECGEEDLVICVVSGGGSALLCDPHDMDCETEVGIISALTVKGASISELNTIRKHISQVKGGHLAKIIYPATSINLIFSDVPGDDVGTVASGPTVRDATSNEDAAAILKKYGVLETLAMPSLKLLETPKEEKYFKKVNNILFVSSAQALDAMAEKAEDLGFEVKIFSKNYEGEAKILGKKIIISSAKASCLLGAGEATVKIMGSGRGGRCQEMALAALPVIGENQVLLCLASDGHDNTEAAGAIIDSSTRQKANSLGLDAQSFLNNNDSFNFFEQVGGQVFTGLTGANISDFFIALSS